MTAPLCETCRWWVQVGSMDGISYGECRAAAPRRNNADFGARRPFAQTRSSDWCGEWDERPEARLDE